MAPNKKDLTAEVERLAELAEVSVDIEALTTNAELEEKISELTEVIEASTAPDGGEVTTAPDSLDASSGYVMAENCCIRSVRGRMMVGGDEVFLEDFAGDAASMQKHIKVGQVVAK